MSEEELSEERLLTINEYRAKFDLEERVFLEWIGHPTAGVLCDNCKAEMLYENWQDIVKTDNMPWSRWIFCKQCHKRDLKPAMNDSVIRQMVLDRSDMYKFMPHQINFKSQEELNSVNGKQLLKWFSSHPKKPDPCPYCNNNNWTAILDPQVANKYVSNIGLVIGGKEDRYPFIILHCSRCGFFRMISSVIIGLTPGKL